MRSRLILSVIPAICILFTCAAVAQCKVVYVRVDGNDTNDGSTWALAKKSVQSAIDKAAVNGGEVWVKAGTYNERIALKQYVYIYGGFAGNESSKDSRNWTANVTVLDGGKAGSVVTALNAGYIVSAIDGFTIEMVVLILVLGYTVKIPLFLFRTIQLLETPL